MRRLIAAALLVALAAPSAFAHRREDSDIPNRRRPPTLRLIYDRDVVQTARPWTYCWSYSQDENTGVGICADGYPTYPETAQVEMSSRIRIRIPYPTRPENWFLEAYRAVADNGSYEEGVGAAEPIDFKLKPHRNARGARVWDVVFRVEEPLRHYYIDTGGDLAQGDAFYSFHLETTT